MVQPMRWLAALAVASSVACSESSLPTQPTPMAPKLITFSGVFSDSETNTPLAGVTICWPGGTHQGNCVQSVANGSYHFTVDPATLSFPIGSNSRLCPFAFLDGYEQRAACVPLINNRIAWSATLQRTITLDAGRSVRSTVFKGEGNGVVDSGLCEPCKSFNVLVPGSGTLFLSVVADSPESNVRIEVFYEGFENGALQITTQRIVQVIVHAAVVPASFELVTSFTPGL
jgi:hypothetical protein